ncbi:hypothetical protein, partial [Paracoccus beibuensis]|uniref:hypothetical protein n=1 Tax=Paracoccus beibuensis TaxID=547602 RepID=UPI00224013F2
QTARISLQISINVKKQKKQNHRSSAAKSNTKPGHPSPNCLADPINPAGPSVGGRYLGRHDATRKRKMTSDRK